MTADDTAKPYSHLVPGVDFEDFVVVEAPGRVPSTPVELSADDEQRRSSIMAGSLMASAHEHLSIRPADPADYAAYRRQGREFLPYQAMRSSGLDLVLDGGLVSATRARELWAWDDVVMDLGIRQADIAHHDDFRVITRADQIDGCKADGRLGVVLTIESTSPIGGDLDRLDALFGFGVRSMGLVYSESNRVGSGLAEPRDAGLTAFGRRVVRRMNQLGMIIDVSHASDRSALDAVAASEHPVIVSHTGARALLDIPRLKPDDVLRACAASGGVIGISASPYSTMSAAHPVHTLESVMDHFVYCAELVGIEHVTFGLDTHFGDHVAWNAFWASSKDPRPASHPIAYVDGVENPAEGLRNVIGWLIRHDYTDVEIAAVCGGNLRRVIRQVWPH
jgi:membrane dipeptidase